MDSGTPSSRRMFLSRLGAIGIGVASAACTPLRVLTRAYPDEFNREGDPVACTLRAFVTAVIPGAAEDAPHLIRAYLDRAYPFAPYAGFLASDLCRRAQQDYGRAGFTDLDRAQRTRLIRDALAGDGATRRIYGAAIFLAQVSYYGGIYDDERGCPLIDFPGRFRGGPVSYDGAERFLGPPCTTSGNYE